MGFLEAARSMGEILLTSVPKVWDAKNCITEMRKCECRQWRQMEWIGFYFQFCCEKYLQDIAEIPGPCYGKTQFDAFLEMPWDFKAHAMNTSSHQIIVNDYQAISDGVKAHGAIGVILALGKVEYNDEARTFHKWHDQLKGKQSKYGTERIQRGAWSRLRKTSFELQQISFIRLTNDTLTNCGSFQKDFRNADGSPRRSKVLIDLEQLEEETLHFVEFR